MWACKKVDSRFETMDCHAVQAPLAMTGWEWLTKEAALRLLCHAAHAARNDRNNAEILNTPQAEVKLDSSKSSSDSKILDEKCGLQGKSQGSYLSGNDCRDFSPLAHFSLKAESPQVDSSYQRCVGNGGSKGLVWSFMDSMFWDKLCRVCCWDSRSFFMDSKDSKISLLDCSNSGLLNFNAKGFLPAVINIALTNPKAPDPAKNPIKNSNPYIMTPFQKLGDYTKKGDSYGVE